MTSLPQLLLFAALSAAVGVAWGLSELVSAFALDTGYALRTLGAWLLLLVNAFAPAFIYVLAASFFPELYAWQAAVAIGLAWPVVIRNLHFNFSARIADAASDDSNAADQATSVRFERIYTNFQSLAYRMINAQLAHQRAGLIARVVTDCDLNDLEAHARRLCIAQPVPMSDERENENLSNERCSEYIDDIMMRESVDEKKMYLSAFVINYFGRASLEEFIRQQKHKVRKSIPGVAS
jgi:hypothetical protein